MFKTRVGIIGATGYSGMELLKILSRHSRVELTLVSSRAEKNTKITDYFPFLDKKYDTLLFSDIILEEIKEKCDLVFFATPSGTAKDLAPKLYHLGLKIIDISGDFRLSSIEDYQKWYQYDHPYPDLLNEVLYSLPEINRDMAEGESFISNPGCYPTSILLPLTPILKNISYSQPLIIDAKSGVTGAGKKVNPLYLFSEMNENFLAYKIAGTHQHIPEIEKYLSKWSGQNALINFNPHLLPLDRGILSTIYLPGLSEKEASIGTQSLIQAYKNEKFVKVLEKGLPKIKDVVHTNQCHIGFQYDKRTGCLILVSVIDNLLKGASGQAVQNMNLMLGIDEGEGLC
ncbi:MAG: N-acetyl-gamma-glutamyl-phosphate reductase [Spirochaetes bacterium GWB1_36_13]|nr:MAG: N-acetyl-gamma-glutamyl-phosphate reductase [Spirochaetes bacterium GWB1_36_13]